MHVKKPLSAIAKRNAARLPFLLSGCSKKELTDTTAWLEQFCRIYVKLLKLIPGLPLHWFLWDAVESIKKHLTTDPELFDALKNSWLEVFSQADDQVKMFVTKLFFLSGIFDDQICKEIMYFASTTSNNRYRYWTALDISKITFMYQRGFYPEYYRDRRGLLQQIAEEENFRILRNDTQSKPTSHLCIIAYMLEPDINNSMQRVAMMVSNGMKNYFDRVSIITLDSFFASKADCCDVNSIWWSRRCSSMRKKKQIAQMFDKSIELSFVSMRDYHARYQEALDYIYESKPDAIIDITDEYSPISFFYSKDFFTLYLPLRGAASSSFYSLIAGRAWQFQEANRLFHSVDISKVFDWSFPEYIPQQPAYRYDKKELGIREDAFIIVSIGKCSNCCSEDFIDGMGGLLNRNETFIWLIVGDVAPAYLHDKYPELILSGKVIERGYETNLTALCEVCDVLLRTENTGGSGATAIAAMCGLPIAMTKFLCDPMRWLGQDYSKIDTYTELFEYIQALSEDLELYESKRREIISLVSVATDELEGWKKLAIKLLGEKA